MKKYWLWALIVLVTAPLILGLSGRKNWVFDVFSHFRVYYFIAFLIIGIIALTLKKWREMGVSFVLSVVLLLTFVDLFIPEKEVHSSEGLKIASINLLSLNTSYQDVIEFIRSNDFDIVFFQELNSRWKNELEEIGEGFVIQQMISREDNFGIGVFSKVENTAIQKTNFSTVNIPSLVLSIPFEGKELMVINTHPLPPVGESYFEARNEQFKILDRVISRLDNDVILIGDFNSTRFSPNFKLLLESGKLRDSRKGFGLLPTWHAQFPLISVTLDHALVTDGIEVLEREIGTNIGSDHLPVIIKVGWKE